jgi:hypothetical protein
MNTTNANLKQRGERLYGLWKIADLEKLVLPKQETESEEEWERKLTEVRKYLQLIREKRDKEPLALNRSYEE